jgi:hypothetical protein
MPRLGTKCLIAAQQVFSSLGVPRLKVIQAKGPSGMWYVGAGLKIYWIHGHAAASPCPRCASERSTHCEIHRCMTPGVSDYGPRSLVCFPVHAGRARFENDYVTAEAIELQSERHAYGAGAYNADIACVFPAGEVIKNHNDNPILAHSLYAQSQRELATPALDFAQWFSDFAAGF